MDNKHTSCYFMLIIKVILLILGFFINMNANPIHKSYHCKTKTFYSKKLYSLILHQSHNCTESIFTKQNKYNYSIAYPTCGILHHCQLQCGRYRLLPVLKYRQFLEQDSTLKLYTMNKPKTYYCSSLDNCEKREFT